MRPRASQVAKTRLVETEEDVETYRPVLDASKGTIGDRQAELARLEGEPAIVGGVSVSVHCPDTPALSGGRWREHGVGSVFYLPHIKSFIISNLHTKGEVGEVETGLIIL